MEARPPPALRPLAGSELSSCTDRCRTTLDRVGHRTLSSQRPVLVPVLPQYFTPDADIYAVYPQRHQLAARVRAFVDFLALSFTQQAAAATT